MSVQALRLKNALFQRARQQVRKAKEHNHHAVHHTNSSLKQTVQPIHLKPLFHTRQYVNITKERFIGPAHLLSRALKRRSYNIT